MRVLQPGGPKDVWLQIESFKDLARDCVGSASGIRSIRDTYRETTLDLEVT